MEKVCKSCTTHCAVDQEACPNCGGRDFLTALEHEERTTMGKISVHGGLTDQATGAGFSGDPDDERAAGTRVPENSNDPAQVDGLPVDEDGHELTADGEQRLNPDEDGTGETEPTGDQNDDEPLPDAETDDTGTYTGGEQLSDAGRYADWNKADLIGEAERRQPPVSTAGTKAEITQRLLEDDARRENQPEA